LGGGQEGRGRFLQLAWLIFEATLMFGVFCIESACFYGGFIPLSHICGLTGAVASPKAKDYK
jgi:hypothetical protein